MQTVKDWWRNTNYDRDTMQRFYQDRPEWSDLPPEAVARSLTFQAYAAGGAFSKIGRQIRVAIGWEKP